MLFLNHFFLLITLSIMFMSHGTSLPETLFDKAFAVIWNVPTEKCETKYGITFNFSQYNIIDNTHDIFQGDKMVIFYSSQLGLYPYITQNGSLINGGIPQRTNLKKHLKQGKQNVEATISAMNFTGPAVVDWENWRPLFNRNFGSKRIYQSASRKLVKRQHPTWNRTQIIREAKIEFERAAREMMESTLNLGEKLRNEARWGFYGFPRIYRKHLNKTRIGNDRLGWLFSSSTGLYPSIYLHFRNESWQKKYNFVVNTLNEAFRIYDKFCLRNKTIVVPYARFRYTNPEIFYVKNELMLSLLLPATVGSAGVVLWDSSLDFRNRRHCHLMKNYLTTTLGPFVKTLTETFEFCSERMCNSNGRCVRSWETTNGRFQDARKINTIGYKKKLFERQEFKILLRLMNNDVSHTFERDIKKAFVCKCYSGWKGKHCQFHRRSFQ